MPRAPLAVLVLAIAAFGLTSCGGDTADTTEATTQITVTGTDALAFEPDAFTVPAGEQITVELTSEPGVEHDFVIEELGDEHVASADAGETGTGTFTIDDPGSYTVYCAVPGHREAGMEASLTAVGE